MTDQRDIVVIKFGSSVLNGSKGLKRATLEVGSWVARDFAVVAVVSAVGDTTDMLLATIDRITGNPCEYATALALASGEDAAAALLGIALRDRNMQCVIGRQDMFRVVTRGDRLDGHPVDADVAWFEDMFEQSDVIIVPGFVGRCRQGEPSLLGRGGSDLTAIFLARQLNAVECRLIKDVDGVFAWDPNQSDRPPPPRLDHATWTETARISDGLVQMKAIRYAERVRQCFTVAAFDGRGTVVGREACSCRASGEECVVDCVGDVQ